MYTELNSDPYWIKMLIDIDGSYRSDLNAINMVLVIIIQQNANDNVNLG